MTSTSFFILASLLLAIALSGCEAKEKQQVLTFFFTGVPPLEESGTVTNDQEQQPVPMPPHDSQDKLARNLFSHPIWASGSCDPCHEGAETFSIPGVQKQSQPVFRTGGGMPAKLILPENKLCIQCHRDKTPLRALTERLWLHNTTAKGDCLVCHDPHQSRNRYTLRKAPEEICLPCHEKGIFLATPVHQTGEACLSCHNPHMGLNKMLLTKEYQEHKIPAAQLPASSTSER